MTSYRKDQWTSSFEDQLSILRPHLTQRVLGAMGLAAWNAHGLKGEDPIEAARKVSAGLDQKPPPATGRRPR